MKKTFLILHGWGGSDARHWQHWLYEELQKRSEHVLFPTLPHADQPQLEEWLAALEGILHERETHDFTHDLTVASDNDAYISEEKFRLFAEKLEIPLKILPEAGHINVASGFGPWPWMLEEVLEGEGG